MAQEEKSIGHSVESFQNKDYAMKSARVHGKKYSFRSYIQFIRKLQNCVLLRIGKVE